MKHDINRERKVIAIEIETPKQHRCTHRNMNRRSPHVVARLALPVDRGRGLVHGVRRTHLAARHGNVRLGEQRCGHRDTTILGGRVWNGCLGRNGRSHAVQGRYVIRWNMLGTAPGRALLLRGRPGILVTRAEAGDITAGVPRW